MPESVEAEEIHLFDGFVGGPFLHGHAVGGDENSGAVFAEMAMNEDLLCGIVAAEQRQKLGHLVAGGRCEPIDRNTDEVDAEGLGLFLFPLAFGGILTAQ